MPKCQAGGCLRAARFEVILYDVYPDIPSVFYERDHTCPFLCGKHMVENEAKAQGTREPRGFVEYPYTNKETALGFTIYKPIS